MRKMSDDLNRESFKITSETAEKMKNMMEANSFFWKYIWLILYLLKPD